MGKIIAIGGGEMGRPKKKKGHHPIETTAIDKEIVVQTGKKNPKLLFIPTASSDSERYYEIIKKQFTKLGCTVDVLYLIREKPTIKEIQKKISYADAIYVGGGNTLKMMRLWRRLGIDTMLKDAHQKRTVLSGLSAGSICWFDYGNSDSRKYTSNSKKLIKVTGLGLINALHCPHYDKEPHRQKDLKRMMKTTKKIVAIALENCSALEIIDEKYRIIKSKSSARAFKIFWKQGKYYKEIIPCKKEFSSIKELLAK